MAKINFVPATLMMASPPFLVLMSVGFESVYEHNNAEE